MVIYVTFVGMDLLIVLFWATVGSVVSMAGGVFLLKVHKYRQFVLTLALPFAAGALLAAAFLDLLPEALRGSRPGSVSFFVLAGFLAFFLLERFMSGFHHHHEHGNRDAAQRPLIVISDAVHNAIDGVAIGAAFLVNVPFGIVTALAVGAHEIPKEIGNFGLLLAKGMRPVRVLMFNLLSAFASLVAAVSVYVLGSSEVLPVSGLLAVTAGFFIYIAASDIIPEMHEQSEQRRANVQTGMLLAGIVAVGSAIYVLQSGG